MLTYEDCLALVELTPEQVAYKGLTAERERLFARLREIVIPRGIAGINC